MSGFFQEGKWYIDKEKKIRRPSHRIVEAIKEESHGKLNPVKRYLVKIIGRWIPPDTFDLKDISHFEMVLFEFEPEKWLEISQEEKNLAVMNRFSEGN